MNTLEKFRIMVQLALVDQEFEAAERKFINELAQLNNISLQELDTLIQKELENKGLETTFQVPMDFTSKIEILADMVKVMKADGKVFLSEIKFCEMIAKMFGFKEKSIGVLSEMIHKDPMVATNWSSVEHKMKKLTV